MHKHPASDNNWAVTDFAPAKLGDKRLVKRLQTIATDLARHPATSIPEASGGWAKTKAAYRFFDNKAVEAQAIMDAHAQATLQRARAHPVVLCVQDTTTLNYSTHPRPQGLGPISNNRDQTLGLLLHSTLAVTPAGQPLGLLHAQVLARDRQQYGRSSQVRNTLPLAQKESRKWLASHRACQALQAQCPDTLLVNVADREGDIYDLFAQALAPVSGRRVELVVRAQHNRQVAHPQSGLWEFLAAQPVAGQLEITVPRQTAQPARLAALAIRFAQVTLRSPCLKEAQPPLTLWAVVAREPHPPKGAKAICWRLLTTLPVTRWAEAIEKIRWYAQRWQIEVLHKVLKSGCQIERRQLETVARLQRLLMVDLVVAGRVMALCKAGREKRRPDWPATGSVRRNGGRYPLTRIKAQRRTQRRRTSSKRCAGSLSSAGSWLAKAMVIPVPSSSGAACATSAPSPKLGNFFKTINVGNAKSPLPLLPQRQNRSRSSPP